MLDYLNREKYVRNSDRICCDVDVEAFWNNSWGRNYIHFLSLKAKLFSFK